MNYRDKSSQLLCFMLLGLGLTTIDVAQAQTTRSLAGQIDLDVAPAIKDLAIDITVRNHGFVVIPPTFTIIRPIQSMVTTRVIIAQGESNTTYSLTGIVENPVDYTIQIKCAGCEDIIPTQYYSADGNRFGLADSVYIDPDDLPSQLALVALTHATISGEIKLLNPASKDLNFTIEVANDGNPDFIVSRDSSIKINKNDTSRFYQITGLPRSTDSFLLTLRCNSCLGSARRKRLFETPLSSQSNHTNIDFTLTDEGIVIISPIINLLLGSSD